MMTRLRGRASLMVIVMISFALLIVTYHILSNEVEDISSNKLNPRMKIEDIYPLSDLTENPLNIAKKQILKAQIMGKLRSGNGLLFNDQNYEKSYGDNVPLFKGHKIVHLDLKGAPPKVSYYKYLFKLLKKLGATGLLLEYEDMFPFDENLKNISAGNGYSKKDIQDIQELVEDNKLMVIPLIQTFGHMEFVLKLDTYKDYREVQHYPQALCPTHNKTLPLIYNMIDQVVALHPNVKHLHIGADEVYQIGECSRCLETMAKRQWGKKQLFLDHVAKVARYIKDKYPELTVLMWDDEFRDIFPQEIIDKGLHTLIEPVIWKYTADPGASLTDQLWESYASVWKNVWVATAFKGATAPDSYYTELPYHMLNHQRWLELISKYSNQITFKGVMLTGWQRYDHFSVLCELLPVALPSLAVNLAILKAPDLTGFPMDVPASVMQALRCDGIISLSVPEPQYGWSKCGYQGVAIYATILRLFTLTQEVAKMEQDNTFKGWLKPYNIKHAFSSPIHVEHAITELNRFKMELVYIEKEMRRAMEDIYDIYTIQEWVETYLVPLNDKFTELWDAKTKILDKNVWPRRPLKNTEL